MRALQDTPRVYHTHGSKGIRITQILNRLAFGTLRPYTDHVLPTSRWHAPLTQDRKNAHLRGAGQGLESCALM